MPGPIGIRRREEGAHGAALGETDHRGSFGARCIHHRPDVVHPRLERRRGRDRIGHAGAALVEMDQAGERSEVFEPRTKGHRQIPGQLDVGARTWDEDDVEGAFACDPVRDGDVATPGVAGFGDHWLDSRDSRRRSL